MWAAIKGVVKRPVGVVQAGQALQTGSRYKSKEPPSLDAIGQRNELVRQRIDVVFDRLDDLKTLREDFADIVSPLAEISAELPRAAARIAELESTLSQEMQLVARVRQESQESYGRLGNLEHSLATAIARAERAESELQERDITTEQQRNALRDKTFVVENLERQLFAETEQSKALAGECKALRVEAQAADTALSRSQFELGPIRERATLLDQDNRRLQAMTEEQSAVMVELRARLEEAENSLDGERQQTRAREERLLAETAARERAETQYEAETNTYRTERSGLMMKLEAVGHRAVTAEQIISQLRNQLRDRDEAFRAAERSLKEAVIARSTVERRLENVLSDMNRQNERFVELQHIKDELVSRCDMLTKAMAAKDVAQSQASSRVESLETRIEQLVVRHEAERTQLDLANRKLTEDLENEKSERSLLKGALEIARESRVSLQKQHDALKRAGRGMRLAAPSMDNEQVAEGESSSNVHPFAPGKDN